MCCSPHTFAGGNMSLNERAKDLKLSGGLTIVTVALGWSKQEAPGGHDFDLDASAIGLREGTCPGDDWFVFYGNLAAPGNCIVHSGDNRDGKGEGDDEVIIVDLTKVPSDIDKIVFPVSIHEAEQRDQHFGLISDAYIRLLGPGGATFTRYDLDLNAYGMTSMVFGELYRTKKKIFGHGEWKFRAVGQGYASGLRGIALDFGVNVSES